MSERELRSRGYKRGDRFEQRPLRLHMSLDSGGGLSVSGPSELVPPQIRPGSSCLRAACPLNSDLVCGAGPDSGLRAGNLAPFRPLCPEITDGAEA